MVEEHRVTRTAPLARPRWEEAEPRFRDAWKARHAGRAGERWDKVAPRYRFGWEWATHPRYRGQPWYALETDMRQDWEAQHPNVPWQKAVTEIQDAWEHATED